MVPVTVHLYTIMVIILHEAHRHTERDPILNYEEINVEEKNLRKGCFRI